MAVFLFGRGSPVTIDPVFSGNSWEQIIKMCQMNKVPDSWEIGDYKNMTIGDREYLVAIIGKKHDTYSDGTGMAPLTLQLVDCYKTGYRFDDADNNSGGWGNSEVRTGSLPTIMALMPGEVQSSIREVNKKTSAGGLSSTINTTADKLFLLAEIEVFGSSSYSAAGEGSKYPYYNETTRRSKKQSLSETVWWMRSPYKGNDTTFCYIRSDGSSGIGYPNSVYSVSFAFCF